MGARPCTHSQAEKPLSFKIHRIRVYVVRRSVVVSYTIIPYPRDHRHVCLFLVAIKLHSTKVTHPCSQLNAQCSCIRILRPPAAVVEEMRIKNLNKSWKAFPIRIINLLIFIYRTHANAEPKKETLLRTELFSMKYSVFPYQALSRACSWERKAEEE